MIARYTASISIGGAVTFGLLFLIQHLIATGAEAVTDPRSYELGDFVHVVREPVVEVDRRPPEKPVPPDRPPKLPSPQIIDNGSSVSVSVSNPTVGPGVSISHRTGMVSDGEYLPIVIVEPVYPSRALARDLEGYVIVEFTVTRSGTTRDAIVVESSSTLFERAAVNAALRFKYKPRVIDGMAIEVPGVRNKISFAIAD